MSSHLASVKQICVRILLLSLALATSCPAQVASEIVDVIVHSPALEHNQAGDPADQKVSIYLPAAYRSEPTRHFATVYFLHGFGDTPVHHVAEILQDCLDKLIAKGAIEPMIVVAPNGRNRYFGAFYTNSVVTGNWEDYIVRDVVGYVDAHYRTIRAADSRGIGGHSMGGYGALMLGFKHPDVFSNIYAMSPCCTTLDADIGPSNGTWARVAEVKSADELSGMLEKNFFLVVFVAMDASFSPDAQNPPLFGDPPFRWQGKQLVPDPDVLTSFQAHMVVNAIPGLLPKIRELKGIYIDYGAEDEFSHIPLGAREISAQLATSGVPHAIETYEGTHGDRIRDRIEDSVLPWFSKQLRH